MILRLRRAPEHPSAPPPGGPVVFFLPARNEAPRVGAVLAEIPGTVCDRRVVPVVVDDGSTDGTGLVAAAAGARVVPLTGRGLGAAVRAGLREAVALGASAVVFCDADGEYSPDELDRIVGPILDGGADYVVGSRFAGAIERMLLHRRVGNTLLTRILAWIAAEPITDGQSGFRALSRRAAAAAEIAHDYNYAQVLTLDLLAKGFGYDEVPIAYRFRASGQSFVRLGPYLRAVAPAVFSVVRQSSTTWAANSDRAADHRDESRPSSVTAPAAATAMFIAWWVLSWAKRPWRPKVSSRGMAVSASSTVAKSCSKPRL